MNGYEESLNIQVERLTKERDAALEEPDSLAIKYADELEKLEAENASTEQERIKERERAVLAEERLRVANREIAELKADVIRWRG